MADLPLSSIVALALVALLAGLIDAIAGGGGLLTVPALLTAGLPPHLVFGTNKGSSVFGSFAALLRFWRSGFIDLPRAKVLFPLGLLGSFAGAALLLLVDPAVLKPLVLVLLLLAGAVVSFVRPKEGAVTPPSRHVALKAAAIALVIGAYDGFFGPGTGTFLIIAFVAWLHFDLKGASANAKVVNFASNLAAVVIFASRGTILWRVSLPMAAGQLIGGTIGAQLAIKGGNRFIRYVVLAVVVGLVGKLAYDLAHG